MIIGIITALTILFGSGTFEVFFLPNFEKGVKEYVIGKERQKEITSDLKQVKGISKEYYKKRKSDIKRFESLNSSRLTNEEDFAEFFTIIQAKRDSMQKELIDARIHINTKIESSEWDSIVAFASASSAKLLEKEQKKNEKKSNKKSKELFDNTLKSISQVGNSENQKHLIDGIDRFRVEIDKLSTNLENVYVNNKAILTKKDTSKQDLMKIAEELNMLRYTTYMEVVTFHKLVKNHTNEEEWEKIMKSFNKELTIPN